MNPCSRKASVTLLRTMAVSPAATSLSAARALSTGLGNDKAHAPRSSSRTVVSCAQRNSQFLPSVNNVRLLTSGRAIGGSSIGLNADARSMQPFRKAEWRRLNARAEASVATAEPPEVEKFAYQAEVSRLLDLIVHSLYSHKEVFLRELVSNASDALDKLRFLSVTEPGLMDANPNLEIRIRQDPERGTISIMDTGIGMTKQELIDSLGTIAQSGTAKFLSAIKENKASTGDNNLIGQFGVGFYSAFLVADKVSVSTKNPKSDKQWVWSGEANTSEFTVTEETDPDNIIPRGSVVTLHLKSDDKLEYTDAVRIQNLVKNYSQFISFPIYTWQEKSVDAEVEDTEAPPPAEGEPKKMKTITQKVHDWVLVNDTKPIWMRNPKEVPVAEYKEFFKNTFKEFIDPLGYTHFSTEGEVEFKSLLFVPGMAPITQEDQNAGSKTKNIRLYVKRVFISDSFEGDLFPRYLGFVKGIVDSNDLPLNVSREILQESRIVRIMKKRLIRKSFDMLDEIANRKKKGDYKIFWTCFGKNIKLGCVEDSNNHKRLAPLLRFYSSKHEDEMTSLESYINNMKTGQQAIYFLAADTLKSCKSAPFLEQLLARDYEVLFLIEPIDEVSLTSLQSYKDKKFVDISKEDLDLGDEDVVKEQELETEYRPLCDWMKNHLGERVAKVQISKRLSSSPCVLVSGKHGWSANMERIMKAQALGDSSQLDYMRGKRILEINPEHPIILDLNEACKYTPYDQKALNVMELLYETAHVASGFTPENSSEFGTRVYDMLSMAISGTPVMERRAVESYPEPQVYDNTNNSNNSNSSSSSNVTEVEVVSPDDPQAPKDGDYWKS